jgi:hypothetical protein
VLWPLIERFIHFPCGYLFNISYHQTLLSNMSAILAGCRTGNYKGMLHIFYCNMPSAFLALL